MSDQSTEALAPNQSFWSRRIVAPIVRQLRQGVTPEKIALTVALGLVIGVFPILGATTILCGVAAAALGLNQPIIQLVNYFVYPAQLVALIPFYRAGESLFNRPHMPLSIQLLTERFKAGAGQFFADFGVVAVQGVAVWCLVAPVLAFAVYYLTRPPLRLLAHRMGRGHAA
ncbi:MAG: DUF2062 domain-containing protein [Gemmatimonadetes bacterium]|nr:DUF2062 domain-containing protein [Gemmatimonadota bacterium]